MNHESMPGPVVMASQTCSGVASTSSSRSTSNSLPMSGALLVRLDARRGARMDGDHDPVRAATLGLLVVVLADQRGDRIGQFLGERRAVVSCRETHLAVHREGGHPLASVRGA